MGWEQQAPQQQGAGVHSSQSGSGAGLEMVARAAQGPLAVRYIWDQARTLIHVGVKEVQDFVLSQLWHSCKGRGW